MITTYLLIGGNTLAQNTPDNNKANPNAQVLSNGELSYTNQKWIVLMPYAYTSF